MNPIDLEIYWNRLIALIDQAGAALMRTSFSTVVRESNDFACVLLDEHGRLVVQSSVSVPGFIGTAPLSLRHMLKVFPKETLRAGDVLFTNDPWIGTGHLPDSTIAAPVFNGDRLIGYIVTVAHLSDVGGRQWSADSTEIFEEGIRFPVVKLVSQGKLNQAVLDLLAANVRLPEEVLGDINAQLAAAHVAQDRIGEFLREYGLKDLNAISTAIYDASEQAVKNEIARIPPGIYKGSVTADGWDDPVEVRAAVEIGADGISIDYAGSSQQSRYGINESYNHTFAYTVYPFKCLLCPTIPNNDGFIRLFDVKAPVGSIVNCRSPAAVGARQLVGHLLQAAIFEALAPVLPDKVCADSGTPLWTLVVRGLDPERKADFSTILFFNGGMGASRERDGRACTSFPGNISNTPIEITENVAPLLYKCKRLHDGSGGKGDRVGGAGQVVAFESRWPTPLKISLLTERTRVPAKGLFGGGAGAVGYVQVNGQRIVQTKDTIQLDPGDTLELALPGGGGVDTGCHPPELV